MAYVSGAEEATSGDFRSMWTWKCPLPLPLKMRYSEQGGYMQPENFQLVDHPRRRVQLMGKSTIFPDTAKFWLGMLVLSLMLGSVLVRSEKAAQSLEYGKEATIDRQGNIYVSSDEGKLIKVANTSHCSETRTALDRQTMGCRVKGRLLPEGYEESLTLEIYRKGGQRTTIEPGAPMGEWHFWKGGQEVSLCSYPSGGPTMHTLYDAATGHVIEKLAEPADKSLLPQWAKDQAQIEAESVPMSPALSQERTKWINKVLWEIQNIRPGMRRKDLLKLFTTEGGIQGRRYVLIECPYIKVDVEFKAGSNGSDEDIIKSVSKPYLEGRVTD
jgi:hypothetical protein